MTKSTSLVKHEVKASGKNFALVGFHNAHHSFVMPVMHNNDDIKNPTYWANCTRSVKAGDFITVRKADHSYIAQLYVRSVEQNYGLIMFVIYEHNLSGQKLNASQSADEFEIGFAPAHKHRILRKGTREVLAKGFDTKEQAEEYLKDYLND